MRVVSWVLCVDFSSHDNPLNSCESGMADSFDPYHMWLGISPREQPANYYRLLGVCLYEDDTNVIQAAAGRQITNVETYRSGDVAELAEGILAELTVARECLLDPEKKTAYDEKLRAKLAQLEAKQRKREKAEARRRRARHLLTSATTLTGALRYAVALVRRFWVLHVSLASAYRSLGQDVYREGRYRELLEKSYARLEKATKRLNSLREPNPKGATKREPRGCLAAIVNLAGRLAVTIVIIFTGRRRRALFRRMGRMAYEHDPQRCGPEELTQSIDGNIQRLGQLDERIARLSEIPPGHLLSPKRAGWILIAILVVFLLLYGGLLSVPFVPFI